MNEIVVISGKGGTGKTTLIASLMPYFGEVILADCDVDAPDLHILFEKKRKSVEKFIGLKKAHLNEELCIKCGKCYRACKFDAITEDIVIQGSKCEGCGVCEFVCPVDAIEMRDAVVGELYISETESGEMVHARLIPGEETSGKLVSAVRKKAKQLAQEREIETILIDGSPGIACNVISSITGAKKAVIVIESSLSGLHDLDKVYQLTKKFRLPVYIVVNKYDLSMEAFAKIEEYCKKEGLTIDLKIPFNKKMVEAITKKEIPSVYDKKFFNEIGFMEFVEKLKVD